MPTPRQKVIHNPIGTPNLLPVMNARAHKTIHREDLLNGADNTLSIIWPSYVPITTTRKLNIPIRNKSHAIYIEELQ